MLERLTFLLLLVLVAWLPVPYGSNRPWAWSLMQLAVFGLLALWLAGRIVHPTNLERRIRSAAPAGVFLLLALGYLAAQAVALPMPWLEVLSSATHELYLHAFAETEATRAPLSVDAGTTLAEGLKWAAYLTLMFLVLALVDSKARLVALTATIVVVGVAEAVFGIYVWLFDIAFVDPKLHDGHSVVSGTFVNRNHYAAHLAMAGACALGLLAALLEVRAMGRRVGASAALLGGPAPTLLVGLAVIVAGFVLASSRGAMLGFGAALGVTLTLAMIARGLRAPELRLVPWLAGAMGLTVLASGQLGVFERFVRGSVLADERLAQWQLSAKMLADFPLFGVGAGNYAWVFPLYRDGSLRLNLLYDRAHSDYLETLIEQGIVGSLLLGVGVALLLVTIGRAYLKRRDPLLRGVLFGTLTGMVALLAHSAVEFNFRIPANAAYFFVLAGLGLCAATLRHDS